MLKAGVTGNGLSKLHGATIVGVVIDRLEKGWQEAEKGYNNDVFHALDIGAELQDCPTFLDHPAGGHQGPGAEDADRGKQASQ